MYGDDSKALSIDLLRWPKKYNLDAQYRLLILHGALLAMVQTFIVVRHSCHCKGGLLRGRACDLQKNSGDRSHNSPALMKERKSNLRYEDQGNVGRRVRVKRQGARQILLSSALVTGVTASWIARMATRTTCTCE